MPQRQGITRIDCEAVQGPGSYVKVRRLTVGDIRLLSKGNLDQFEVSESVIRDRIVEWNWADDEGHPLPQVQEDPAVFDSVTDQELTFLAQAIAGNAEARKN